ncbi:MAG: 1,4-alpha-glucan branching protein GlgB [Lachnospiraceae bacterium]|nr:1,4-alpha-glucan branching protein GlgB [Lachnospiraceae bacterium]
MNERLYNLMDWAGIEALVYSEEDNPHQNLGPHLTDDSVVFLAFFPDAKEVFVQFGADREPLPMEMEDEAGYFAAMTEGDHVPAYTYRVVYEDGEEEYGDPYAFPPQITEKDTKKFNAGICYDIYKKLGAHPMTIDGISGVYFAVWAPCAMRVSVVGDFNRWDGRMYPMRRLRDAGIFELFVPGLEPGALYKYEIKAKGGLTYLKADPYANASELRPDTASIVADLEGFEWHDDKWLEQRENVQAKNAPMAILEVDLATFDKPGRDSSADESAEPSAAENTNGEKAGGDREFYNYCELALMIADYAKENGYTHIELMPVMEHVSDESLGYEVTGYYAPTARFGTPADFMYFMNYMHEQGIGVILDWVPSQLPRDTHGLAAFDGTCLYEHLDPRKGVHPKHNTLLYNYGRPEVSNFLIANALFWKNVYHADGLRMDSVASMLYLDYDRRAGEWVPNMYGGNENLEAVEFFKHLNSIFKKQSDGAILIAEDSSTWPKMTAPVEEDGLGFDYKWNTGWTHDTIDYLQLDPFFRSRHHDELTLSMIYNYSEDFIVGFSHDVIVNGQGSMLSKMPGKRNMKFANLRAAYGFMVTHPGKKHLFMGQDIGQNSEWNCRTAVPWEILEEEDHQQMKAYIQALLSLYQTQPALYQMDFDPEGFEWIDSISANENTLAFLRRGENESDMLLVVCNFSPLAYEKYRVGVPFAGKYKEIFNSDSTQFGGSGKINPRVKASKPVVCDDRENSIEIQMPPMGIAIFTCAKETAAKKEPKKAAVKPATMETKAAAKPETKPAAKKAKTLADEKPAAKKAKASAEEKSSAKEGVKATVKTGTKPAAANIFKTAVKETSVKASGKAESAAKKPSTRKTAAKKTAASTKTKTGSKKSSK